jgi:single-strand DNA-binding protein
LLIGNLTRDPELRYTPAGMAVTSFGLATNRVWVTKQGERKEDAQFHRIVAWNKLAELCSQLLSKGRRIYVEGRIQYREITDQSGVRKQVSEIVIDDMIILDNKGVNRSSEHAEVDLIDTEVPEKVEEETAGVGEIEDIMIPDEVTVDEPVAETPKVEEKVEEKKEAEEKVSEEPANV